jgi:hypothetical protein
VSQLDNPLACAILAYPPRTKRHKKMTLDTMFLLAEKSNNRKTGPINVSTSPNWTCPASCPFKEHGCYGLYGHILMWWQRISEVKGKHNNQYNIFLDKLSSLPGNSMLRHNQAGDFFPDFDKENCISISHALKLLEAVKGKRVFCYTHYPVVKIPGIKSKVVKSNREILETLNAGRIAVNISGNSPAHADAILDSGLQCPVVTVLPSYFKTEGIRVSKTPKNRTIVTCPAILQEDITCLKCKACLNTKRKVIIGFPAHSKGFKYCEKVLKEWESGVPNKES